MDLFYGKASGNFIVLDPDESNHLVNVRRSNTGDIINVTDGEGKIYSARITELKKKECTLEILKTETIQARPASLHIAIAPTKNIDRIEWFLEKATESGIEEITFLLCRHSERKEIKTDRLNRVAVAAMKQSVKSFLPRLNPITDFKKFISGNFNATKLICTTGAGTGNRMNNLYVPGKSLVVLIGPEGDFHEDEISLATQNEYKPASLGESRLRTETAALTVCTIFNFVNQY